MEEKRINKQAISDEIYRNNEINANKALSTGCVFSAIVIAIIWALYLTGVFGVTPHTLFLVNVSFPFIILALMLTLIYNKTKLIEFKSYKYFVIFQYILVCFVINMLLPKHGILLWATCILLANHYYSPKLSIIVFITVAIMMLLALYAGMLLGEWDSNLMNGNNTLVLPSGEEFFSDAATLRQRLEWLRYRTSIGDNRYVKALLYYYLARVVILSIISNIGYSISKRSLKLLKLEAKRAEDEQRIISELEVANNIQSSVLPKALDDDNKENIFGLMSPAKEVGGDLYDYFYVDDNHLALVVADVSGKGIPASLFMMKTEALIKSLTTSFKHDTQNIMKRLNISLCSNNDESVFVTCWLGILDLITGELKYTNAGHNKPIIIHKGVPTYTTDKPGVVLGAFEGTVYKENTIMLDKNDKILLYTDGVTEAHNENSELYGEHRLLSYANINNGLCPKDFVTKLRENVRAFAGSAPQFDDITLLMFKFDNENEVLESRTFNADVKELDNLFDYSSSLLEILEFSKKDIIMINTALEEVFVNVAKYAYDGNGTVEITLSKSKEHVTFVFKDNGKPFNPLEREDPNINAGSDEREIGGLGIFMVKKIMDKVEYEYRNHQNVLTLVKYKSKK